METRLQQVFQILRWSGAAMILAAAGTFLVQSWDQVGDVNRYLALLGTTLLLPALAYVCGIRWREGRSARMLMMTLLAVVPIHAGVIGGFVLSQFGQATAAVAPVAQWVAPNRAVALVLVAGAGVALVPLIWSAFRVLARPHARMLTAASVASHALLLVPSRSPLAATLIVVPIMGVATWVALRMKPRTLEEKLATCSLLAPAAVVAARQVLFYDVSNLFWGAIFSISALALFVLGRRNESGVAERIATIPTLVAMAFLLEPVGRRAGFDLAGYWLTYGLASAVPLLAFAWQSTRNKAFFVRVAVALNATTAALTLLADPRPWAALQAIAVGLGMLSYGWVSGRKGSLYSGIGLAACGFILEVVHAIDVFEPSGWLALAGSGFGLVALTAWLEQRSRTAKVSSPVADGLPQ